MERVKLKGIKIRRKSVQSIPAYTSPSSQHLRLTAGLQFYLCVFYVSSVLWFVLLFISLFSILVFYWL